MIFVVDMNRFVEMTSESEASVRALSAEPFSIDNVQDSISIRACVNRTTYSATTAMSLFLSPSRPPQLPSTRTQHEHRASIGMGSSML